MKLQSLKIKAFEIRFFIQANLEVKTTQDMSSSLSFDLMMSRFFADFHRIYLHSLSFLKCSHMCDLKSIPLHVQMSPYHRHHYLIFNRESQIKNKNMAKLQYNQNNKGRISSNKDGSLNELHRKK